MGLAEQAHVDEAAASLGLAATGIARRLALPLNLLPPELRVQQTRWVMVPSIVLGAVIVLLAAGFAFRSSVQEQIMIRTLDDELRQIQGPVGRVQALEREAQALEKRIGYIERTVQPRDMNLEVLQELTTLLPPDTFLNLYANREGAIQINGSSASASDLIPKLERSPWLKNVQQRGTVFKDAQTGKDRFNLEARLEKRE
jgi:general secretion pathway protein L